MRVSPKISLFVLWDNKLRQNIVIYPSCALSVSWPEISETLKATSTKRFATVRVGNFDGKSWHPISPGSKNFSYKTFLAAHKVLLWKILLLWDKTNWQKVMIPASRFIHKICNRGNFLKIRGVRVWKVLVL